MIGSMINNMACYFVIHFVIFNIIYLPLLATQERERLAGEIVPVRAEQSGAAWAKQEQHGASNAIDLDPETNAIPVLIAGGGTNPWFKVFFDQVHCIQQVLFFTRSPYVGTWTCSGRTCECKGSYTFCRLYTATVSTATEQAHVSSELIRPECIYGDIITINVKSSAWVLPVREIAVIGLRKEDQILPTITPPPTTATTDVLIVGSTESSETKPQSTTSAVLDQGSTTTESLAALTFSCLAGNYMTDSGCQQCGENTFSAAGASSCTNCSEHMVSAAGSTSEDDCSFAPCSAGNYMTDNGCQQCGDDTFSAAGASFCSGCREGMVSAAGSTSDEDCFFAPCSAGNYMTDIGCQQCGENTFSAEGASSCTNCSEHMVSATESTSEDDCSFAPCSAGNYMTDIGCQQCGENTFSADGASSCTSCPEGMVSEAGSTSDDCFFEECPAGQYRSYNMTTCANCRVNTVSEVGSTECTTCPAGSEANANFTSCSCTLGWHSTNGDRPPCRRCERLDSCQSKTSEYMDILNGAFKSGNIQGVINGFNVIVNSDVSLSPENAQQLIQLLSSIKHLLKNASTNIEGLSTAIMEIIEIVKNSKPEFSNEKKNSEIIEIIEAVSMTLKEGSNITTASMLAKSIVSQREGVKLDAPKAVPKVNLPVRINFGTQEGQRANVVVMDESFKDILPKPQGINDTIGSPIVSVNFMNTQKVPKSSFSLTFQLKQYPEHEGYTMESQCVYLNTTTDEWMTNGCTTIINKDETCTCNCSHTTSFAILMSPTKITDTDTQELVSYIVGLINIMFLSLTFCLVAPFKKLRNKQLVAIQLSLILTLILGHVSFASLSASARITVDASGDPLLSLNTGCVAGVTLTQYFFLSAFFWMGCIAWTFFKKIANAIKTFGNTDKYYFHKCAVISWVCPAVFPVAALLLFKVQNKDGYTMPYVGASKENGTSCWVENPWRYIGFLAPGYLILLFNCVCFGMVARVIIKSARLGKGNTNVIKAARAMMVVAVSVGLPWIVIGLAVGPVAFRAFVQYLFIVLSGMQGPLLFIAMIIFQDEATESIRKSINEKKQLFSEMKQSTSAYITYPTTTSKNVSFKRGDTKLRAIDEDLEE
ncbi:adhesion G protein-coupled receptor E2-like isoform X2 [Bolinopsis microptera]|uniref:adhesion G protein-coupled receptor E2-like isoform X2 n=1 Tax=Bolinopsis microptera TaxID=2820187 RepID=UPI00307940C6